MDPSRFDPSSIFELSETDFGQPQTNVEHHLVNVTAETSDHTCLKVDVQSESMLPSVCDDVIAMEYVCTTPVHASHRQYSNVSNTNDVAVNVVFDECVFSNNFECIVVDVVDPYVAPPINNDIPTRVLDDTRGIKRLSIVGIASIHKQLDGCADNLPPSMDYVHMGQCNQYSGLPQRVNKFHPNYMSLQFSLLFVYDEEGYEADMKLIDVAGVTPLKYHNGRLPGTLLHNSLTQYTRE
ncbi:hypothetical protein Tco_0652853 [Tanacetum coccineum]|uniref:Uncharacterized protein n=1 Tax=Tanacetum coccineum TaxID=301880 RepID=A0ABQ4WYT0_9ASTR